MENRNRQVLGARRVLKNDQVGLDRPTGRKQTCIRQVQNPEKWPHVHIHLMQNLTGT
jgi:hypothetical protein